MERPAHADPKGIQEGIRREREASLAVKLSSLEPSPRRTGESAYSSVSPSCRSGHSGLTSTGPIEKGYQSARAAPLTTKQAMSLKRKEFLNTTLFLEQKLLANVARAIDSLKKRISTMKIQQTRAPKCFTPIPQATSESE